MSNHECPSSKVCTRCKVDQPLSEFSPNKTGKYGKQSRCKACYREIRMESYRKDPAKDQAMSRRWKLNNPERNSQIMREWRDANVEHRKAYAAEQYRRDPERGRDAAKAWRDANPGKSLESVMRWVMLNPVHSRGLKRSSHAMSASGRGLQRFTPAWADKSAINKIYIEAVRMTRETGRMHHVDHIIPINGKTVSGLHWEGNLQILLKEENLTKGTKFDQDIV